MTRTLLLGLAATVLAAVVWLLTSLLGVGGQNGLLGVAAGLLLGMVRYGSPLARYGGFLVGLVLGLIVMGAGMVGWVGYVAAMLILTVISGLTGGRLPLWAMILGGGVLAAMYQPYAIAVPWYILTQLPTALLVALATSAGGFIAAVLVELIEKAPADSGSHGGGAIPGQPQFVSGADRAGAAS